jgi:hypothetical protein
MSCSKLCIAGSAALIATVVGLSLPAIGQPDKNQPDPEAIQQAYMDAGTPGAAHKQMAQIVGEWDTVVKFWQAPGETPGEHTGTMSSKAIYDGRFIESNFTGDMGGMPFEGRGTWGFNNISKKFEGTWIDSMSTGFMYTEGTADAAGKVFTSTYTSYDPITKTKKTGREVVTIKDADHHVMQMFDKGPDGKEFLNMEITYTRKGAAAKPGR